MGMERSRGRRGKLLGRCAQPSGRCQYPEDEEGRQLGVYVRQITPSVYEYEFNSRISQGERFMKEFDDDYYGPETDSITETWNKGFRRKKAAYMAEKKGMQNKNVKL